MIVALSTTAEVVLAVACLAASLALSGLFSGMETGLYVLNKVRLELRAQSGSPAARLIHKLVHDPANFLTVILVGNNVANYVAVLTVSFMFLSLGYGHEEAELLTLAVATPLLFVLAESVPKNVFQRLAERLVYRLAWALWATNLLLNACLIVPLVRAYSSLLMRLLGKRGRALGPMGHDALATIMAEGQATGLLTHFQSIMADRVMHLAEVKLKDVMIPMSQVVLAPRSVDREHIMALMRAHDYSRFPVADESGHVVGILNIYDVMAEGPAVKPAEKARAPLALPADSTVNDALFRMQRAHAPMAVVEEHVRHVGIVTIKDLVEQIVGELAQW